MHTTITYTEYEIVLMLKTKDEKVFAYLYEKFSSGLYSIILQIIHDAELANDLLQETFMHVWNKAESYDSSKGRLFTWMLNIARNLSIDMQRSKGYRNSLRNQYLGTTEGQDGFGVNGTVMPEIFNNTGLTTVVRQLKPQHRSLIELVYFQGYTQVEVAELLHIPLGTIKTRIRHALAQLKEYLSELT